MYGAVFGDIIGSWYEWHNKKSEDIELFPREARFTDDTVLTVAIAESILHMEGNSPRKCYANPISRHITDAIRVQDSEICLGIGLCQIH